MSLPDIFTTDFKDEPFWWIAAPRPSRRDHELPGSVDVAIIGSGVTGLNAARELGRAGRSVAVLDAEELGFGGSSRNAGNLGRVLKYEYTAIRRKLGETAALGYYREMQDAYDTLGEVIRDEGIACHYQKKGRLVLSYTDKQQKLIVAEAEEKRKALNEEYQELSAEGVRAELGSHSFVGGICLPDSAAFHPGLYHLGLIDAAERQGARLFSHTRVDAVTGIGNGFRLATTRGPLEARNVVIATNGYSIAGVPGYFKRRLIPFDAYMIAIRVPRADLERIMPKDRVYIDANHNLFFFRRAPDDNHVLFGGRTGSRRPADLREIGAKLYADACRILPDLADHRVSRSWTGRCAGTFDLYPHIGEHDGIHYAAGYCFAGMPMGTYLGRKLAYGIIGDERGRTIYRERSFPTVPGFTGSPWFMPYFMKYYDWLDRRDGGRPAA
jgi:glycine/D-amino acid oxidase-like deaminating enzyme